MRYLHTYESFFFPAKDKAKPKAKKLKKIKSYEEIEKENTEKHNHEEGIAQRAAHQHNINPASQISDPFSHTTVSHF